MWILILRKYVAIFYVHEWTNYSKHLDLQRTEERSNLKPNCNIVHQQLSRDAPDIDIGHISAPASATPYQGQAVARTWYSFTTLASFINTIIEIATWIFQENAFQISF